jgi:hypothetical protein
MEILVTGLDRSRFRLFEDGLEQVITSFSTEDVPASIGLVLDASGSIDSKLKLLKDAATQFVRAANSADEYFLLDFQERPRLAFTSNLDQFFEAIDRIKPRGWTALFDAVQLAVDEMSRANNPRKAVLIVSDGMDNHSRYTARETRRDSYLSPTSLFTRLMSGNVNWMETDTQLSVETRQFSKPSQPRLAAETTLSQTLRNWHPQQNSSAVKSDTSRSLATSLQSASLMGNSTGFASKSRHPRINDLRSQVEPDTTRPFGKFIDRPVDRCLDGSISRLTC